MSKYKRCIDDVGLVHYANFTGVGNPAKPEKNCYSAWCSYSIGLLSRVRYPAADKRTNVTCFQCLRIRASRGPGGLLPHAT